ncbi:MAG: hypothetical protein QXE31_04065 [Candidatus Woesearchaeota archaeon]
MVKNFTYLGIDETTLGIETGCIVVAAETKNPELTKPNYSFSLKKGKDYLREAEALVDNYINPNNLPNLPTPEQMIRVGMSNYHWLRINNGRFNRQGIEHAGVAHLISCNGYSPQELVVLIDAFHGNLEESKEIILEILKKREFYLPKQNIDFWFSGDKAIPIINFADLLALQIGLYLNEKYRPYFPERKRFPIKPHEISYEKKRMPPIDTNSRKTLEEILKKN